MLSSNHQITLDQQTIDYTIKRSHRLSIGLSIGLNGLSIYIPKKSILSVNEIEQILLNKQKWILSKLKLIEVKRKHSVQEWSNGASLPYLGENIVLSLVGVTVTSPRLSHTVSNEKVLLLPINNNESNTSVISIIVTNWLKQEAYQLFSEKIAIYESILNVKISSWRLSTAKTRWGSCSNSGKINLNWRLIQLPLALIDYVIVHELAHLKEMNHSAHFWKVVSIACPDYKDLNKQLSCYSPR